MAAGILQEQEEGPCHPVGQDVSTGQSDLQPTRLDNINLTSQTPFIPENHAKYPQAGPFAHWISTPTNLQFPPHPNMYGTFSGPASMQNLAYNHQYSQSTLSQNPPYCQHHSQPTLLQTPPYYQQNSQPAHSQTTSYHQQNSQSHPIFQSQHHQNLSQSAYQTPPPTGASNSGGKLWTSEEDLQLCRAWVRVSEDAAIGVGQKRDRLWDRVRDAFHKLMREVYGKESSRNSNACDNRMRDLKSQCSKWAGIRALAFQQPASGSSLCDTESLARQMWEDGNNGKPFKHMACWNVLKECSKWYDPARKPVDKNMGSSSQPCVGRPQESEDTFLSELYPDHTASSKDRPITPVTEEASTGHTDGLAEKGASCIPILNGPASTDICRPPGQKKAKGQKGHNKQRLSDAQYLVSQTLRDGMVNFQTSINTRWEKSREDQRLRDKTNKQALQEELRMQAQHDVLDLAKKRSSIIDDIDASAEKLILAVKKLEELGPASVLTPNQKLEYELRQRTVSLRKRQYAELNESLQKTEKLSPSQMKPVFGGPRAVTSQRRLDYEEEVNLVDD